MNILGISAFYHDSAAALIRDGEIIAAAEEERFSRIKHDSSFPIKSIEYCLSEANLNIEQLDAICFYDKPFLKFERIVDSAISFAPKNYLVFIKSISSWLNKKLYVKKNIKKELSKFFELKEKKLAPIYFTYHHQAHASSSFFTSNFEEALVLCLDGVGEWATTTAWYGKGNQLEPLWEIQYPHSLGLLYSAFTYYLGFKVNSGEYKVMGLAPYGEPIYSKLIKDELIDIKEDGSFALNLNYFAYTYSEKMINTKFEALFGMPTRIKESKIEVFHKNIAASIQKVIEEIVLKLANSLKNDFKFENLCLAGGVALNCVSNTNLREKSNYNDIWVQPASGDSGGAIGSALSYWFEYLGNKRDITIDRMKGAFLGPSFNNTVIERMLDRREACFKFVKDSDVLHSEIAQALVEQKVIGLFQGRMEFGPRALGGRSIIADGRNPKMKDILNLKIKHRESFRPFAPAILKEHSKDCFKNSKDSPYMLFTSHFIENHCLLNSSVAHVDGSARVQTINKDLNPFFYSVVNKFYEETGCPLVINTSFNERGEPIVQTPENAFDCFMNTDMDLLVLENYILYKDENLDSLWNKSNWKED